jgi:O-antigen ligase
MSSPVPSENISRRTITALIQLGLVAVVFVAIPYKAFELDRYFVPKELVLHIVALAILVFLVARMRQATVDAADVLLAVFLVWSVASTLFATNYWLAQRALGVSVSSAIVFWGARRIGAEGLYRPILVGAAVATVCGAVTALAQAYGMEINYFSLNRAPGGTFGNRNFVAHFCAIGLPALIYSAVTARRPSGAFLAALGTAVVAATLVLSRSRAAWLGVATSAVVLAFALFMARRYFVGQKIGARLARLGTAAAIGAGLAMLLPNTLNWSSDSPYLDSARGLVDYSRGSGRGRVAQYLNSGRMAASNPIFGVGPGNWPVRYVRFAPGSDPSIGNDGMTANPWPSSDWVAFVSERGVVAAVALLIAFAALFIGAFRRWPPPEAGDNDVILAKLALAGTITATLVVSAFDAALLLPAPALLAWSVIGAASGAARGGREMTFPRPAWATAVVVTLCIVGASVARSATQTIAIATVGPGGTRAGWIGAAAMDPGSYRINLRVAQLYAARGRCPATRFYARRARDLFPYAGAPRALLAQCR